MFIRLFIFADKKNYIIYCLLKILIYLVKLNYWTWKLPHPFSLIRWLWLFHTVHLSRDYFGFYFNEHTLPWMKNKCVLSILFKFLNELLKLLLHKWYLSDLLIHIRFWLVCMVRISEPFVKFSDFQCLHVYYLSCWQSWIKFSLSKTVPTKLILWNETSSVLVLPDSRLG